MTDGRALAIEYLKQQRLLGGDAVILTEKPGNEKRETGNGVQATESPFPVSRVPKTESREHADIPPSGISFDPPSGDLFATDPIQRAATLADVATLIADCLKCKLCEGRTNTVPGEGSVTARLVVIGEGPGRTEDETGRPFVSVEPAAFTNMFFGVGVLKVKALYRKLRRLSLRHNGVIVFFDEADSLGNRGFTSRSFCGRFGDWRRIGRPSQESLGGCRWR